MNNCSIVTQHNPNLLPLITELYKSCTRYWTMTTKNDQNLILVTGASGNVATELIKELSTIGAIYRAGVHSNKSSDKMVDCVDINFGIVLANL